MNRLTIFLKRNENSGTNRNIDIQHTNANIDINVINIINIDTTGN